MGFENHVIFSPKSRRRAPRALPLTTNHHFTNFTTRRASTIFAW